MKYIAAVLLLVAAITAQNVPSANKVRRIDIPSISREASGSVVSIVMSDKEGHPIAQGSGFLISKDGWIVTNYHVIKTGNSAIVKLPDGAFFAVDGVVACDKDRDVAIIKAHGNAFRTLTLGDSARLQVGEEVVAIGNPLSLESTVSNGIVSAIRTVENEGGKFLQITAPISHGSSGGPLFNMVGEVVGITSAGIMGGENLNFAIPINDVKPMINSVSQARRDGVSALPDEAEHDEAEPVTAAQTTGPSLSDTDEWLNNTFKGGVQGGYFNCVDAEGERIDARLLGTSRWPLRTWCDHTYFGLDMKGCNATLIVKHEGSFELRVVLDFNLKDLDPSSLRVNKSTMEPTAEIWQVVTVETRNHQELVTVHYGDREPYLWHWGTDGTGAEGIYMQPEYAPRFIKAFQHAIELCGGKSSAF